MSEAKVSLMTNPFYMPDDERLSVKDFKMEMFVISRGDGTGDRMRYENFMKGVFPYDKDSRIEIIETDKSWTKEGSLIICVQYVEMESDVDEEDPNKREY